MKIVHLICAARPNFMKVAPLYHALDATDWCHPVVVWGRQHTDDNMSGQFLIDFGIPNEGLVRFDASGGSHAEQTANAMMGYEKVIENIKPDAIVVPGDVNTSLACALVGAKLGIPVVHLEAGLRSFDRSMPEEINRIVIDHVSGLLLTPSRDADDNLKREGVSPSKIRTVGNIMIDTLKMMEDKINAEEFYPCGPYALVTLHRPSNVDNPSRLSELLKQLREASSHIPIVFPVHPRTKAKILAEPVSCRPPGMCPPMTYAQFMVRLKGATIVITDSGGVQEEAAYLGVPCATVRDNTERPITCARGSNRLITPGQIVSSVQAAKLGEWPKSKRITRWDGETANRCVDSLARFLNEDPNGTPPARP